DRARRPIGGVEEIRGGEYRRLRLATLVVDAPGNDRNEFRDRVILQRLGVEHDAPLALARILREELVDFLPHPLLCLFGRRALFRFGHEDALSGIGLEWAVCRGSQPASLHGAAAIQRHRVRWREQKYLGNGLRGQPAVTSTRAKPRSCARAYLDSSRQRADRT